MKLIALSSTVLFKSGVSGGDVVFPQINRFLDHNKFKVKVITTRVGKGLWESVKSEAKIHVIPETLFDDVELYTFVPL